MDNIWLFFQRFVDEQGNDMVKIVRGSCYTILEKINAMEWVARYIEFVTPDTVAMITNYFKDVYTGPDAQRAKTFVEYEHTSEAIPTIIQKIRSKESEFANQELSFWQFDEGLTMLLMILEPLVVNDENLDMMIKTGSVETVSRLILLQRLSVDIDTVEGGQLRRANGDRSLTSYNNILEDEKFTDNKGKIIPMKSFRYILRIMASCARDPNVVGMYVRDKVYLSKILLLAEDLQSEETVANCLKIFRICLTNDQYNDAVFNRFPNILNFMIF